MSGQAYQRSFHRPGRLIRNPKQGLRARAVSLKAGQSMAWHSTHKREELIFAVRGSLHIEIEKTGRKIREALLKSGFCFFIPAQTIHRVVNRSSSAAIYVYVTALKR